MTHLHNIIYSRMSYSLHYYLLLLIASASQKVWYKGKITLGIKINCWQVFFIYFLNNFALSKMYRRYHRLLIQSEKTNWYRHEKKKPYKNIKTTNIQTSVYKITHIKQMPEVDIRSSGSVRQTSTILTLWYKNWWFYSNYIL